MAIDEGDALAGLERSEAALREYAEKRGLVLREEQPWPGYVPAAQQTGGVRHAIWSLAGVLPGGAVGRLRHQAVFGQTLGIDVKGQHTIMVARLPETVGYVPMLSVRPDEFGAGLFYWAGDQRPRESAKFESEELERRYVVEIAKAQGQNWLFQLFSPALIDWLAHETPRDFGFKLELGVFTCETPQWRGQGLEAGGEVDPAALDLLTETGGKVAGRLRDEVLEEEGLGDRPDSLEAYTDWAGGATGGRIVGTILKLVGGLAKDDSFVSYGDRHGMSEESPAEFHARHLRLPLPGTATEVVSGTLPGSDRDGSLAWIKYSSDVDMERNYIAAVTEADHELPSAWVDEADVGVPGVGEGLPAAALEAAASAGWGISSGGRSASVYMRSDGSPGGAQIDAFSAKAAEILKSVG